MRQSQAAPVDTGEFKFIYSPFQAKNQPKKIDPIIWVQDHICETAVILSNPLSFAIPIESMYLRYGSFYQRLRAHAHVFPFVPRGS